MTNIQKIKHSKEKWLKDLSNGEEERMKNVKKEVLIWEATNLDLKMKIN
ncbi:MAG: hypothetical protein HFJ36_00775 [Clostridia bacterium]|nr:hypothetical protein [Clostridia bacterium]